MTPTGALNGAGFLLLLGLSTALAVCWWRLVQARRQVADREFAIRWQRQRWETRR